MNSPAGLRLALIALWLIKAALLLIGYGLGMAAGAEPPQQRGPLGIRPSAMEIELGRKLFFDSRLSQNGKVSCATCHDPATGWSDGRPMAVGILGQVGTRNSPTIINSSYVPLVFWDGRTIETSVQALLPLVNPIEMGQQTEQQVLQRIRQIPGYIVLFTQTYGLQAGQQSAISGLTLAKALAAFESTVVSFNAPIDRFLDGQANALTPDARVGFAIFDRAGCMTCHPPPLFTDNLFHNQGSEFAGKVQTTDGGRFSVVPANLRTADMSRAFKTPTLREVARTAPYMHHGQFPDLKRVALHYNAGGNNFRGVRDRYIDPRIKKLDLTATQLDYLVAFLTEAFASPEYPLIEAPELP